MKTSLNFKQIAKITGILLLGLFLGWLFFGGSAADQPESMDEHVSEAHTNTQGNVVYSCSMHPSVRQQEPGDCPICGMKLIPVNDGSGEEENPYQLTMSEAAMKIAEVQTTTINRGKATKTIRMPGKIVVDERRLKTLPAHFPGRVEELYANFTGEYISKGSRVASVYSPELISAQKELIEVAKHKEQNPALYRAARNKLKNWKIPEAQINAIESSGEPRTEFDINSHISGYVMKRNIAVGSHIKMGGVMYEIADLSQLWVIFQAYENDLSGLDVGDNVEFTVGAYPGETFNARITFIDPVVDAMKRTVSVRAEVQNRGNRLKPQMLAEGMVSSNIEGNQDQLLVPKSAVLWTGERSVVYVKIENKEKPTFEFREVVLGQRVGNNYVVKSGVEEGEEVVTNGTFKIDSAAQLAGKASMMNQNPDGSKMQEGEMKNDMEMELNADTMQVQN